MIRRDLITAIGSVLSRMPQYPHSVLTSILLNAFAGALFAPDERVGLEGKIIRVHVRDVGLRLTVRISSAAYSAISDASRPNVTISADAWDFVQLALRNADPDTLFFDRRLVITGETEVGLTVKNALDRVEAPLPKAVLLLLRKHFQPRSSA